VERRSWGLMFKAGDIRPSTHVYCFCDNSGVRIFGKPMRVDMAVHRPAEFSKLPEIFSQFSKRPFGSKSTSTSNAFKDPSTVFRIGADDWPSKLPPDFGIFCENTSSDYGSIRSRVVRLRRNQAYSKLNFLRHVVLNQRALRGCLSNGQ